MMPRSRLALMPRNRLTLVLSVVLAGLIVAGAAVVVRATFFAPTTITAYVRTARALYPGDDVRVLGVKVGTVSAIQAEATDVKLTLKVDHGIAIPADAKAVIVAPNLVAARYVQLTPAYSPPAAMMRDGALIPVNRTAVPVEWDEVKTQLMRLSTDLGPHGTVSTPAVARIIDKTADALAGNGDKLRQTLAQLSQLGRIFADGGGNIVDIVKNLQTFVTALSASAPQIVSFENRLATLSSVLDDSRSDLDAALTNLSTAVVEVQRFVNGSRDQTAEGIQRLANVTQILVDNKMQVQNVLHVLPNVQANTYNDYRPDSQSRVANVTAPFSSALQLICGAVGAIENVTSTESAKLCAQYLGPALRVANPISPFLFAQNNFFPIPINPYLSKSASPGSIIYSDPALAPGGAGGSPTPPEQPPAISAYTGLDGDVPPPAGYGRPPGPPGLYAPDHLPATPSPALFPGAPIPPGPPGLPQMLLPAETPTPGPTPAAPGTP